MELWLIMGEAIMLMQRQSFADVLQNRCSLKFGKFHRKTPVLESLFHQVAGLQNLN